MAYNYKKGKAYKPTDDEFIQMIQEANSFAECCRKVGLCDKGRHGTDAIRRRCAELNLSTEHFGTIGHRNVPNKRSLEDILVENSTYTNTNSLKKRLVSENLLEYKCAICGNTGEWNKQPLVLVLDHINGNHKDHRIENLRLLCPNCHSQTDTFAGKNKKTPC